MDKTISVYWFAILFIVAGAVVYMVVSFYGNPLDVREMETNILASQFAECISPDNLLNEKFLGSYNQDEFLLDCSLNFNTENSFNWNGQEQYFLKFRIFDFNSNELLSEGNFGNPNLYDFCEFQKNEKQNNIPTCLVRNFYSIDKENTKFLIEITSVVSKLEKNAN